MITFDTVTVRYGPVPALSRSHRADRVGGVGGAHRAQRGRQDHAAARRGRPRPPRGRDHASTARRVSSLSPKRLARLVAYVPQQPELPPDMTVGHYVLLGRTPHIGYFGFETAEDRHVCGELLESLDLVAMAERRLWPRCRAGSCNVWCWPGRWPSRRRSLLLDEPTSALDLGRRVEALELVDAPAPRARPHRAQRPARPHAGRPVRRPPDPAWPRDGPWRPASPTRC